MNKVAVCYSIAPEAARAVATAHLARIHLGAAIDYTPTIRARFVCTAAHTTLILAQRTIDSARAVQARRVVSAANTTEIPHCFAPWDPCAILLLGTTTTI